MKRITFLLLAAAAFTLTQCAPSPRMPHRQGVRAMSAVSDSLFAHMMGGIGGVAFADEVVEGETSGRELIRIEPLAKNNSAGSGKERWTVRHANGRNATYLVSWEGSRFEVTPEKKIKARN